MCINSEEWKKWFYKNKCQIIIAVLSAICLVLMICLVCVSISGYRLASYNTSHSNKNAVIKQLKDEKINNETLKDLRDDQWRVVIDTTSKILEYNDTVKPSQQNITSAVAVFITKLPFLIFSLILALSVIRIFTVYHINS